MPRVTDEYRATRRAEILAAATRLFATNGFHSTSMADIISESRLSAGAVYGYFRSKEEIIGAAAETALSTADEIFAGLFAGGAAPSPLQAVTAIIESALAPATREPGPDQYLTRIAVQVWAEALRNPDLAHRANEAFGKMRGHFAEVARRWQAAGHLPPAAVPDQVAAALLGLTQGFLLQHLLLADTTVSAYAAGAGALLLLEAPTG